MWRITVRWCLGRWRDIGGGMGGALYSGVGILWLPSVLSRGMALAVGRPVGVLSLAPSVYPVSHRGCGYSGDSSAFLFLLARVSRGVTRLTLLSWYVP